jgi:hypothetical protein
MFGSIWIISPGRPDACAVAIGLFSYLNLFLESPVATLVATGLFSYLVFFFKRLVATLVGRIIHFRTFFSFSKTSCMSVFNWAFFT